MDHNLSQQPRFAQVGLDESFITTMRAYEDLESQEPIYRADSRERDRWLDEFSRREPHLSGVLNSVTAIDKNRGWRVVGGRNQVLRITKMLHNFQSAPGLHGWRPSLAASSKSFWSSNIGSLVEIGREGEGGPTRALYTVDPTRCILTGDVDYPLKYYPTKSGKIQKWKGEDFFRVCSLPSYREEFNGLGFCAVDRAVELAKIMIAIFRHDEEKLLARAPRGLLLISGVQKKQWEDAMAARDAELDSNYVKYYGALTVLASASQSVDAKLVALSELPVSFNLKEWMDMLMYGYSLCFGYDASEFWPVQYGALGRGNEVQIQHEKATGKGRLDFVLGFQEQLQNFLPDSIDFLFDQRDEQGDLLNASVHKAWADAVNTMDGKISTDEARVLLAEYGLIPSTWAPTDIIHSTDLEDDANEVESPDSNVEDEKTNPDAASPLAESVGYKKYLKLMSDQKTQKLKLMRDKFLERHNVIRAAEKFPDEAIVEYKFPEEIIVELWESGKALLHPKFWIGMTKKEVEKMLEEERIILESNITVHIPDQPTPIINITIPEQKAPIVNIAPAQINVNLPTQKQEIPIVHVNPTIKQEQPQIIFSPQITVPEPVVNITNEIIMPEKTGEIIEVVRDREGNITKMIKKEG